ncbi:hypothetical protein [Caldithrix abyssi]
MPELSRQGMMHVARITNEFVSKGVIYHFDLALAGEKEHKSVSVGWTPACHLKFVSANEEKTETIAFTPSFFLS